MALRDLIRKSFKKDEDFKAEEKRQKILRILEERAKSSNQRELERFMREKREAIIKDELTRIRNKQRKEHFSTGLMDRKNIFKGHHSVLDNGENPVLTFKMKKGRKMFFK